MEQSKSRSSNNNVSNALLIGVLSLPSYFLFQTGKKPLGLDKLHFVLVQFLLILLFKYAQILTDSSSPVKSTLLIEEPTVEVILEEKVDYKLLVDSSAAAEGIKTSREGEKYSKGKKSRSKPSKKLAPTPSLYEPHQLDRTLYNFLSITSPSSLPLLPPLPPLPPPSLSSPLLPSRASLPTWTLLHSAPLSPLNLKVLQHPTTKSLYAISAEFPNVPLRNLLEVLTSVEKRSEWDTMCLGGETLERFTERDIDGEEEGVGREGGRRGSVGWIGMKGVAIIKAKDMVLLSLLTLLPPESDGQSITPRKRIVCATTSFNHSTKRLPSNEFNRMNLNISGFIVEEMGNEVDSDENDDANGAENEGNVKERKGLRGSRVVQITDLSGLGSWVPSALIKQVTQSMIPKSLTKLGEAASQYSIAESSRYPVEGNEWLPPLLGSWSDSPSATEKGKGKEREFTEEEEEELLSDSEDEDDSTSLSRRSSFSSRSDSSTITSTSSHNHTTITTPTSKKIITPQTIQSVLDEIRSVTSKLAALESSLTSASSSSSTTSSSLSNSWLGSLIYPPTSSTSGEKTITTTTTTSAGTTTQSKSLLQSIKDDYPISVGAATATLATGVAVGLIGLWGRRRR